MIFWLVLRFVFAMRSSRRFVSRLRWIRWRRIVAYWYCAIAVSSEAPELLHLRHDLLRFGALRADRGVRKRRD